MHDTFACPKCGLDNAYFNNINFECPDCDFEWGLDNADIGATDDNTVNMKSLPTEDVSHCITCSSEEFLVLQDIIQKEVEATTYNFDYLNSTIAQNQKHLFDREAIAGKFDLDFWEVINFNAAHSQFKKLQALYEGKSLMEFTETYESISEAKDAALWFQTMHKMAQRKAPDLRSKTIELSVTEFNIVRRLVELDIEDLANDPEYFDVMDEVNATVYIDLRITVAEKFDLEFWDVVKSMCGPVKYERLFKYYEPIS